MTVCFLMIKSKEGGGLG
jgi:hypothetical protein